MRSEHHEEFRSLIGYGTRADSKRIACFHADTDTGRLHLENVRLAAPEVKAIVALAVPFKSDISDDQLDAVVAQMGALDVDMVLNHGSVGVYEKLLRKIRAAGLRTQFLAVDSGSTQLAASLGPLAIDMIFAHVAPNPWAHKTFIVREYHDAFRQAFPVRDFSYGSWKATSLRRLWLPHLIWLVRKQLAAAS